MIFRKLIVLGTLPCVLSGCFAPVIMGGTAVVGTAATESRGLDGVARDNRIRTEVTYKWNVEKVDASGIDVTVYNRRVLLVGYVKDAATKTKVLEALKKVSGVTEVIDELQVGGEESFSDYTRDAWMTTKLKANMMANSEIAFQNFTLRTFNRTVYVFGIAQSHEEYEEALREARSITGIRTVKPYIDIIKAQKPIKRGVEIYPDPQGVEFQNAHKDTSEK